AKNSRNPRLSSGETDCCQITAQDSCRIDTINRGRDRWRLPDRGAKGLPAAGRFARRHRLESRRADTNNLQFAAIAARLRRKVAPQSRPSHPRESPRGCGMRQEKASGSWIRLLSLLAR